MFLAEMKIYISNMFNVRIMLVRIVVFKVTCMVKQSFLGQQLKHAGILVIVAEWVKTPVVWCDPWSGHVLVLWVQIPHYFYFF